MAEAKAKVAKTVNRFPSAVPGDGSAISAALGRRGAAGAGILRNVLAAAEPFGNSEELAHGAKNGVVQSSSPLAFRQSGGNVEARKSGSERKTVARAGCDDAAEPARADDDLPTVPSKMKTSPARSAVKRGVMTRKRATIAPFDETHGAMVAPRPCDDPGINLAAQSVSLKQFALWWGVPYRTVKEWSRLNEWPAWTIRAVDLMAMPDARTVLEARL
jgi:hypothetical protein